ncbi:MAG: hypothetical protein RMM58_15310 [Chloroflexota bacterium]|nr:hypothetical protein [Dehalococcoidia bacterium]MDW8255239.1 hypothetical protein [Chloroflexota bacterium]
MTSSVPAAPAASRAECVGGRGWAAAASAGLLAGAAYLLTLSAHYSSDGMAFARLTREGDLTAPLFFQAEHLLYPFVGWLFLRVLAPFGLSDPLLALQVLNALGGAVAVSAYCWMALRLLPSATAAGAVTVALAASYGWWYHSSDAEDQILANAGILIAVAALVAARGPYLRGALPTGRGWAVVLGLAVAMLIHATSILMMPAVLLLFFRDATRREAVVLGTLGALLVGVPYLGIGIGLHGHREVGAWQSWLLAAPAQGVWGRISPRNLWTGLQSLTAAALWLPAPPTLAGVRALQPAALFSVAATAAMAAGLAAAAVAVFRSRDRLDGALVLWAGVIAAFGAYWAPDDPQFWLLVLPPLYLLAARRVPPAALWVVALPLALWNLGAGILPRHDPAMNAGLAATRCLSERLGANDLVITPGWDWAGDYLPYFTAVNVLSLNDAYVLAARGDRATFFEVVERRIAATRAAGGRVYLVRLDTLSEDDAAFFRRVTGLGPSDFPWRRVDAFLCGREVVREVLP